MSIVSPQQVLDRKVVTGKIQESQKQPNGIDLTVRTVKLIKGGGILCSDKVVQPRTERQLPSNRFYLLDGGNAYQVEFNEKVKVPQDMCAMIIPRSSLNRMGAFIVSGLYDSGFKDRLGAVLRCNASIMIEDGARIAQIVFFEARSDFKYDGQYQKR